MPQLPSDSPGGQCHASSSNDPGSVITIARCRHTDDIARISPSSSRTMIKGSPAIVKVK
jgi:hypothetical protein